MVGHRFKVEIISWNFVVDFFPLIFLNVNWSENWMDWCLGRFDVCRVTSKQDVFVQGGSSIRSIRWMNGGDLKQQFIGSAPLEIRNDAKSFDLWRNTLIWCPFNITAFSSFDIAISKSTPAWPCTALIFRQPFLPFTVGFLFCLWGPSLIFSKSFPTYALSGSVHRDRRLQVE